MLGLHLKTIFSFSVYLRLAFATRWQILRFAVYIFLLNVAVFTFYAGKLTRQTLPEFIKNFPEVTFTQGVLSAPQDPVSVRLPRTDFSIVFDNTHMPPSQEDLINRRILAFVHKDRVYSPGAAGLQSKQLPQEMNFTASQEFLNKNADALQSLAQTMAFAAAVFFIPVLMLASFCAALCVGLFWRAVQRKRAPLKTLFKWAAFLWGPSSALWMINLFWPVPLFSLAAMILFTIYLQQIFNLYPQEN